MQETEAEIRKPNPGNRTASEALLELYLARNGYPVFEHEPHVEGKNRKPDYRLPFGGSSVFLEVKEFGEPIGVFCDGTTQNDPYAPLRDRIDRARKKFQEYKDSSCSLVLANPHGAFVQLDAWAIHGAMLGNVGFQVPVGATVHADMPIRTVFLGSGRMTDYQRRNTFNTTVSSIIVLCRYPFENTLQELAAKQRERELGRELTLDELLELRCPNVRDHECKLGRELTLDEMDDMIEHSRSDTAEVGNPVRLVVHENPFARLPLSRELFCGPFDERWGAEEGYMRRVFIGDAVRDIEARLHAS
ncbi:MAG TPA: hypothetical protein VNY05_17215 [Candidatus Acidoferrales bacterium]|jgi:hypothetical protein|nr:hypothetical protein [Candidatus Acidoferrales bacterium]